MPKSGLARAALALAALALVLLAARAYVLWGGESATRAVAAPGESPAATVGPTDGARRAPIELIVDESIEPGVAVVPPLVEGGEPRPVARTVTADGVASDYVIGEIAVIVPDVAALDALRSRDDVDVLEVDDEDADIGEGIEVLLRIRSPDGVEIRDAGWHLAALDDGVRGELRVSDADMAATLAVLGRLAVVEGLEASLNDVAGPDEIPEGRAIEGPASSANAFDWPYVKSTAEQGIGLDTAWQLLYHHGRESNRVVVMVVDRGFQPNGDFPTNSKMRKGSWGPAGDDWKCSGGNPCPYHGTQVAVTIAGRIDNDYGTAGPAGPFADLVAMANQGGSWETLRKIREVAKEERPDVINMSYGGTVMTSVKLTRWRYDRTFRILEDRWGTLAFASAGNEGLDVDKTSGPYLPCASDRLICVGGMDVDATTRHPNSNFGSDRDERSVEIYGPFCVNVAANPADPADSGAARGCGTSFASPFVAGVAALLRVADPSLSPDEMQQILYDTAHVGGLGPSVSGHLRRIDAHMAVARALNDTWLQPTVSISEGGGTYPVDEVISFSGTARSHTGEALAIRWHSSIDGWLNESPSTGPVGAVLSSGEHVIQATAIDRRGFSGVHAVIVEIDNRPPNIAIVAPGNGTTIYEGQALHLIGYSHDPDPFINAPLTDDQVRWTIERGGSVVWEAEVHVAATALSPGEYVIRFSGTDAHSASAEDTVALTVLELEPGWVPPSATISKPVPGTRLTVSNNTQTVELQASAKGVDGAPISGQRFQWTATSDNGHTIVLCTGSGFPGSGGGGFGTPKSCATATVELGLAPGAVGRTVWALRLVAIDNQGVPVDAARSIEVVFATQ